MPIPYVENFATTPPPLPYELPGVRVAAFNLPAPGPQLQAVVDRWLNIAPPQADLRWVAPWPVVVLQLLDYPTMIVDQPQWRALGWTAQREVYFAIPIVRQRLGGPVEFSLFMPYIWVTDPGSLVTGREVLGIPKGLGAVRATGSWGDYPMRLEANVHPTPDSLMVSRRVVLVESAPPPTSQAGGTLTSNVVSVANIQPPLGDFGSIAAQAPGGAAMQALMEAAHVSMRYSVVHARQLRDPATAALASQRGIIQSGVTTSGVRDQRPLPPARVTVPLHANLDVLGDLGIVHAGRVVVPFGASSFTCDIRMDWAGVLWEEPTGGIVVTSAPAASGAQAGSGSGAAPPQGSALGPTTTQGPAPAGGGTAPPNTSGPTTWPVPPWFAWWQWWAQSWTWWLTGTVPGQGSSGSGTGPSSGGTSGGTGTGSGPSS